MFLSSQREKMYNLTIMQVLKYATLLYYILLSSSNTVVLAFLPYSASRQSLSLFHSSNNEQFLYKKLFYTTSILNKHASNRKRVYSRLTATNLGETTQTTTHISNYIVDIHSTNKENEIWSLYKEDVSGKTKKEQPCMCLYGERMNSNNSIHVKVTQLLTSNGSNTVEDTYFLPVLSRILAQRLLFVTGRLSSTDISTGAVSCATEIRLDLPFFGDISPAASTTTRTITEILPPENHLIGNPFVFFEDLLPNGTMKECELVELVDIQGQALAALPRIFIHNYNMLHRGIGVLVVQPELQLPIHPTFMDLMNTNIYCHQRTWSKRIFPGLYDMFIGGVSAVDEPAYETAKRELEEELGILVNLSSLSPPLFQCTIRTTYNHCIVTVFFYQCASDTHFTWQKDEVVWGDFIPYRMVERAGELSIRRLNYRDIIPSEGEELPFTDNLSMDTFSTEKSSSGDKSKNVNPLSWDFVPDGILVWKAWKEWISKNE